MRGQGLRRPADPGRSRGSRREPRSQSWLFPSAARRRRTLPIPAARGIRAGPRRWPGRSARHSRLALGGLRPRPGRCGSSPASQGPRRRFAWRRFGHVPQTVLNRAPYTTSPRTRILPGNPQLAFPGSCRFRREGWRWLLLLVFLPVLHEARFFWCAARAYVFSGGLAGEV